MLFEVGAHPLKKNWSVASEVSGTLIGVGFQWDELRNFRHLNAVMGLF